MGLSSPVHGGSCGSQLRYHVSWSSVLLPHHVAPSSLTQSVNSSSPCAIPKDGGVVKLIRLEPRNGGSNRSHLTRPLSSGRSSRTGTWSGGSASAGSQRKRYAPLGSLSVLPQRSHIPQAIILLMVVLELEEIVVSSFQQEGRSHSHHIVHTTLW